MEQNFRLRVAQLFKSLENDYLFFESRQYQSFIIPGAHLGAILLEIGTIREGVLRKALHGSGNQYDLDGVDEFYYHAILWDKEKSKLVGGYRFRSNQEWQPEHIGTQSYLEKFYPGIYCELSKKHKFIELGRAFVSESYQHQVLPVFLLWKNLLTFFIRYISECNMIIGIPWIKLEFFKEESVSFLVKVLSNQNFHAPLIETSSQFPYQKQHQLKPELEELAKIQKNMITTFQIIGEIEGKPCTPPSLLKHYIDIMRGRTHGLCVAPKMNNFLGVLISTNVADVPNKIMKHFVS